MSSAIRKREMSEIIAGSLGRSMFRGEQAPSAALSLRAYF